MKIIALGGKYSNIQQTWSSYPEDQPTSTR